MLFALTTIPAWLFVENAIISIILLSLIDLMAFIPTIRKTLIDPFSENILSYELSSASHIIALFAITDYNFVTIWYSAIWAFLNIAFFIVIQSKRSDKNNLISIKKTKLPR